MAKHARGLICLAMSPEKCDSLKLPLMVDHRYNNSKFGTAFTVTIDAAYGISSGISAYDRAKTILTAIRDDATPQDLVRPGHIFPLRYQEGGTLVRAGHTEGAIDLVKLAGLKPYAVICEIMDDDGTMARLPKLEKLAQKFHIKICSITDIIEFRRRTEKLVEMVEKVNLPTRFGRFKLCLYRSFPENYLHVALCKGNIAEEKNGKVVVQRDPVLVRVHSECLTGDLFRSLRCDCGDQLEIALKMIAKARKGVLLYMRQEGRGIGFVNKIKAYALQEKGFDTVEANKMLGFPADLRHYGVGAQILYDLGVRKIHLLTNNPKKIFGIEGFGLKIIKQIPIEAPPNKMNRYYLKTKKKKLGHLLTNI
jgi:3,4-dihydroxy 2-butanone 4-phosphate synthase/GTP cyclohydrolase II